MLFPTSFVEGEPKLPTEALRIPQASLLSSILAAIGAPQIAGANIPLPSLQSNALDGATEGIGATGVNPLSRDRQALLDALNKKPQMQGPGAAVRPAFRTQDAFPAMLALISAAIGGKKGGELAEGIFQGALTSKLQKADEDTRQRQMLANWQNQQAMQEYQTGVNVANTQLGFSKEDQQIARQDEQRREAAELRRQEAEQKRLYVELDGAQKMYQAAKTLPAMQAFAKRWADAESRSGAQVISAPMEEQVKADYLQKSNNARNVIYDNWRQFVDSAKRDNYGMVMPGEAARLNRLKKQFEEELRTYGIEDAYLPEPPTEASKKAEYMEQLRLTAAQRQIAIKEDSELDLLKFKADVQYKKEKLKIDQARLATGQFNADTQRMSLELRQEVAKVNKQVTGKIQNISAKIEGLRKKQAALRSPSDRQAVEAEIQNLDAQRKFWETQKEDFVPPSNPEQITASSGFTASTQSGIKFSFKP